MQVILLDKVVNLGALGDIVKVKIEDADEYDLYGEVIEIMPWNPKVPKMGHRAKA